jgi:arginase family enzyme
VNTSAIFLPFDLFGSRGAGAGAELLADAFQEMLADNERERLPTRARAYANKIKTRQLEFRTVACYQEWRDRARHVARQVFRRGDFLLWVAGNHLGVLPVYDELGDNSRQKTLVVQLDAHLDIYNLSDCTKELSHGNFLLHAASDLPEIINVGTRELLLTSAHVEKYYGRVFPAAAFASHEQPIIAELQERANAVERVFIDIDCDVFDPAYFPAVANPLPFGLAPRQVLGLLDGIWSGRVVGLSLSEFDPSRDQQDRCLGTLLWLVEYLLLKLYEGDK